MNEADYLIVGGGVAGLSAVARLSRRGRTILLEAEEAIGYHASGRSATFSHFGIGNRAVRALTARSRAFFLDQGLGKRRTALFVATAEMVDALFALELEMQPFAPGLHGCDEARMRALCPVLRFGGDAIVDGLADPDGLKLDSNALLQLLARQVREAGGRIVERARVAGIAAGGAGWRVETEASEAFAAPVLINAAGAWADAIAGLASVAPLGLTPMRRTIITLDPLAGTDVSAWPFVKTAVDDFYILPEAGRLIASPVDEIPSDPCDALPEEYDIALAAWKVERYTTLEVARIGPRWAGLRTFTPDRLPAIGFDPEHPGFFWLAGQGGFGLQTAPAAAEAAEALVTGGEWPQGLADAGIIPEEFSPARLRG